MDFSRSTKTFLFHLFFRFSIRSFFNDDFWKSAQREFHAPNDSSWKNNFGQNHFVFLFMASGTGISKDRKNPFYILKLQQFFALTEITQKNRKSLKKEKSPIQICFLIPCSESFAFTRILISFLRHQGYQHWASYHKACENFNGKHSTWQLSEKYRQGGLINGRVTRAWKTWFKWYLGEWTWWEWNGNILKISFICKLKVVAKLEVVYKEILNYFSQFPVFVQTSATTRISHSNS